MTYRPFNFWYAVSDAVVDELRQRTRDILNYPESSPGPYTLALYDESTGQLARWGGAGVIRETDHDAIDAGMTPDELYWARLDTVTGELLQNEPPVPITFVGDKPSYDDFLRSYGLKRNP